ncbi:MAG: motility protein A, partial [Deltaproteobacteria bacterium]
GKLKNRSSEEVMMKDLMTEGVISIAKGENPRVIEQKLNAYLPPQMRQSSFNK